MGSQRVGNDQACNVFTDKQYIGGCQKGEAAVGELDVG